MNKLILTLALVVVTTGFGFSQSRTFDNFKQKYGEDERNTSVTIQGSLFDLVGAVAGMAEDDEEAQAFSRLAKGMQSLEIISLSKWKNGLGKDDVSKLRKGFAREDYEELMKVRDDDQIVNILAGTGKNEIKNMLIMIEEGDELTVMNINGLLKLEDLAYLAKNHKDWD